MGTVRSDFHPSTEETIREEAIKIIRGCWQDLMKGAEPYVMGPGAENASLIPVVQFLSREEVDALLQEHAPIQDGKRVEQDGYRFSSQLLSLPLRCRKRGRPFVIGDDSP